MCITHFADLWAYKTKTRFLIMEIFNQRNQKQTTEGSREGSRLEAWGGPWCSRSLGGFATVCSTVSFRKQLTHLFTDYSIEKHIPGLNENDLWLSTQFGYLGHLFSLPAWTIQIYMLSGECLRMSQHWSGRGALGRTVDPRAADEGRALVLSWGPREITSFYHLIYKVGTSELNFLLKLQRLWKQWKCKAMHTNVQI